MTDGLVRISVGIEDWRDLLADFEQALAADPVVMFNAERNGERRPRMHTHGNRRLLCAAASLSSSATIEFSPLH